jgi:hypothetical protein
MTVIELLRRLNNTIEADPEAARLPVKISQYDDPTSNETGEADADGIDLHHDRLVIL